MTENEELAQLVGFTRYSHHENDTFAPLWKCGDYLNPDPPDLFHDLNALDKWVAPVLRTRGIYKIVLDYSKGDVTCDMVWSRTRSNTGHNYSVDCKAPTAAAALASAALKFLKER